jgi:hypothetical protein
MSLSQANGVFTQGMSLMTSFRTPKSAAQGIVEDCEFGVVRHQIVGPSQIVSAAEVQAHARAYCALITDQLAPRAAQALRAAGKMGAFQQAHVRYAHGGALYAFDLPGPVHYGPRSWYACASHARMWQAYRDHFGPDKVAGPDVGQAPWVRYLLGAPHPVTERPGGIEVNRA